MVFLQEMRRQPDSFVFIGAEDFQEESSFIFEYVWMRNHQDAFQGSRFNMNSHGKEAL